MTTFHPADHRRFARQVSVLITAGASVLALAACGSSTSQAAAQQPRSSAAAGGGSGQAAVARTPAVSGLIAAWANNTMQVQGASAQTAVTLTAKTRITEDRPTTAKAVTVGACVTVRDATARAVSGAPASPQPTAPSTGPITAATVQIRPAVKGSCSTLANGFASGRFTPRARPSGAPSGFQGRGFGGQFRAFGATGQVASVSSTGFVVTEDRGGTTSSVSVLTGSSTAYTTIGAVTRSAVKTGECALATGPSDSTGAVTATALVLSQPVNGSCAAGLGFGGGAQRNG